MGRTSITESDFTVEGASRSVPFCTVRPVYCQPHTGVGLCASARRPLARCGSTPSSGQSFSRPISSPGSSWRWRAQYAQLVVEGRISQNSFEEWNRETGSKRLPEHAAATTPGVGRLSAAGGRRRGSSERSHTSIVTPAGRLWPFDPHAGPRTSNAGGGYRQAVLKNTWSRNGARSNSRLFRSVMRSIKSPRLSGDGRAPCDQDAPAAFRSAL